MKYLIHQKYYGDIHHVWCSECYDARTLDSYSDGHRLPASSNPADIYRQLKIDVDSKDTHSAIVKAKKATYRAVAQTKYKDGQIDEDAREEIFYLLKHDTFDLWRPLLFVIPRISVEDRLSLVPIDKRAGTANEYTIENLQRSEFDLVEF